MDPDLRRLEFNYPGTNGVLILLWVIRGIIGVYDFLVPGRYYSWPNFWVLTYDLSVYIPIVTVSTLLAYDLGDSVVAAGLFLSFSLLLLVHATYVFVQTQKVVVGRLMMSKIFAAQCLESDLAARRKKMEELDSTNGTLGLDYADLTSNQIGAAMHRKQYMRVVQQAKMTIRKDISLVELEKTFPQTATVLALGPGQIGDKAMKAALYKQEAPVDYSQQEFTIFSPVAPLPDDTTKLLDEDDDEDDVYEIPLPHVKNSKLKISKRGDGWYSGAKGWARVKDCMCMCRWMHPIVVVPYEYAKEIAVDRTNQHINLTFLIVAWNSWVVMFMRAIRADDWFVNDDAIAFTTGNVLLSLAYTVSAVVYQRMDYATYHLIKGFFLPAVYILTQQWSLINELDTKGKLAENIYPVMMTLLLSFIMGGLTMYGVFFFQDKGVLRIKNSTLGTSIKKSKKFSRLIMKQQAQAEYEAAGDYDQGEFDGDDNGPIPEYTEEEEEADEGHYQTIYEDEDLHRRKKGGSSSKKSKKKSKRTASEVEYADLMELGLAPPVPPPHPDSRGHQDSYI